MATLPAYTVRVEPDKAGTRLDRLLSAAIGELSRSRLQALIADGLVALAGEGPVYDASRRVRAGECYVVTPPPAPPVVPEPQAIPLTIVYEDDDLIVIDKPAGLVVHPGAGQPDGTLVNALLARGPLSAIGAPLRPGIVHRLDKDTSGLMVVAKTDAAHAALAGQFARHTVERAYMAAVWGHPQPREARILKAIGRCRRDRTRMAVVSEGGKAAITRYRVLRALGTRAALVECRLATGRTHQIRVHMAAIGHPVVGDPVYTTPPRPGAAVRGRVPLPDGFRRQALHAFLIGFSHPRGSQRLRFESEMPQDMSDLFGFLERV
jgi:23S rRNA pseudouridine1911/1915/1917 synthase